MLFFHVLVIAVIAAVGFFGVRRLMRINARMQTRASSAEDWLLPAIEKATHQLYQNFAAGLNITPDLKVICRWVVAYHIGGGNLKTLNRVISGVLDRAAEGNNYPVLLFIVEAQDPSGLVLNINNDDNYSVAMVIKSPGQVVIKGYDQTSAPSATRPSPAQLVVTTTQKPKP